MSDWYKGKCPECGKEVPVISPRDVKFCSRQCESNSKYRGIRFKGSENRDTPSSEEVRKLKY